MGGELVGTVKNVKIWAGECEPTVRNEPVCHDNPWSGSGGVRNLTRTRPCRIVSDLLVHYRTPLGLNA